MIRTAEVFVGLHVPNTTWKWGVIVAFALADEGAIDSPNETLYELSIRDTRALLFGKSLFHRVLRRNRLSRPRNVRVPFGVRARRSSNSRALKRC
jgi:hypothetical protein